MGVEMKRSVCVAVAVLAVFVSMVAPALCQEEMAFVGNDAFDRPQRGPAAFFHDTHNENAGIDDCAECHHLYGEDGQKLDGESSEDQACSECHGPRDAGRKPKLTKAFHQNCKGCHINLEKGPILCAQCHSKR